ncbi:MAG: peptidoglycan DD-metalloendopeptidase family protein [Magnetococcales bacterium]|nr:peptidoglycan DD-metalloendopeptidase family protein [Magnetococcales bacterium]MBF0419867.1 peptidoglycan DD-metalloendopeptidase family protein [Magnetococcales bacterium]
MSGSLRTGFAVPMPCQSKPTRPWLVLCFGLAVLATSWVCDRSWATPGGQVRKNRANLNQTLKNLETETKKLQIQEGLEQGLLAELELLDQHLNDLMRRRDEQTAQLQKAREELPELAGRIEDDQKQIAKIRGNLAAHVRFMFGLGEQGVLKIIFSQESAAGVRQGILYYGRLLQARNAQLRQYADLIAKRQQTTEQHRTLLAQAQGLTEALAAEWVQLEQKRAERGKLLVSVRDKKNLVQQKIDELNRARGVLTTFVDKLHHALGALPANENETTSASPGSPPAPDIQATTGLEVEHITQKKGHLHPPVKAHAGHNHPPGLFYPVDNETAVKAIYRGQVVYADWFRGYGLLVILNHGDHIYSLYGYNQKLLVAPGDWVENQETIATSGSTGSLEGVSGVYFEIRDKGQAVNPHHWLGS